MSDVVLTLTPDQVNAIKNANVTQQDFILLDRTGSMASQWGEAIGAVNTYVQKLKDEKVPTKVTIAVFDRDGGKFCFDVVRKEIDPQEYRPIGITEVHPRGMTPLNDAIGQITSLAQKANAGKCVIIIMTDGAENSSTELTVVQAQKLLQDCRNKGWQVIFLGANFDNVKQAESYGTSYRQTAAFAPQNLATATAALGQTRSMYATGEAATMDFSDEDRVKLGDITKDPNKK